METDLKTHAEVVKHLGHRSTRSYDARLNFLTLDVLILFVHRLFNKHESHLLNKQKDVTEGNQSIKRTTP